MNWDVVKQLVAYGREKEKENHKKFRFTLTTNGVLLNEDIMEFANKEMSNVVLSIDGRASINDKMRPSPNGKGSYELILPKFQKFVEKRKGTNYYVRGTFTKHNLDFAEDVLHLARQGFEQISVEPVVGLETEEYAITDDHVEKIQEEYNKLAKELLKKENRHIHFFHFMIDLEQGPCALKRLSGCGSGTEYLAITPKGDLYPCHQFVGIEEFKLGNVHEGITNGTIVDEFKSTYVYTKPKCLECWAKFYCSGGCAANAYKIKRNLKDIYEIGCQLEKKRVECAIMMKVAEREESSNENEQ